MAEAAKWLVNNGDLYKEEGINFNNTWLESNLIFLDNSDNDEHSQGSPNIFGCNSENMNSGAYCNKTRKYMMMKINGVKMRQKHLLELLTPC